MLAKKKENEFAKIAKAKITAFFNMALGTPVKDEMEGER